MEIPYAHICGSLKGSCSALALGEAVATVVSCQQEKLTYVWPSRSCI